MAARLARRPLLPSGVPEGVWLGAGTTSTCLFVRHKGAQSGAASLLSGRRDDETDQLKVFN